MAIEDDAAQFLGQQTTQKPSIADEAASYLQTPQTGEVPVEQPVAAQPTLEEALASIPRGETGLPIPTEEGKKVPGFMKRLEMLGTGAMKGSLEFTSSLLKGALGSGYKKDIEELKTPEDIRANISRLKYGLPKGKGPAEAVDRAGEYWTEQLQELESEYGGPYGQIGQLGAELLTTAPVAGPLGYVAKGAQKVGQMLPTGLKTLGKYGTSGVGGAGILAGLETQRAAPGQMFNLEAAQEALESPLSYAIPMVGTKIQGWAEKARQLGQAKNQIKNVMARDIMEPGPLRRASQSFFDALPSLTGMGKRINQLEGIGDDIRNFVKQISGGNEAILSKDLVKFAGTKIQSALGRIKKGGNQMWNKPFKTKPIQNTEQVKDLVVNASDILKGSGIPLEAKAIKFLQQGLRTGKMTVDDVKNLQSIVGDAAINAKNAGAGGIGNRMAKELTDVKNQLLDTIQDSLSPDDMADFMAAREYSGRQFQMFKDVPKLQKAVEDEVSARKLVKDIISDAEVSDKKKVMDLMSPRGQKAIGAAKVAKALEDSDVDGRINLGSFLDKTAEYTQTPEVLGNEAYKSLQGLNKYLSAINEAARTGFWRQATALGAAGAAVRPSKTAATAALVSYPVAVFAANHSPLKTIFNAMTKNLPDSTFRNLIDAAQKHLTRAGYLITDDGVLKHESEPEITEE